MLTLRLLTVLTATTLAGLFAVDSEATLITYSNSNVTLAADSQQSFSLLSPGVLLPTDEFTVSGTVTFNFTGKLNFDALFLITDGTVLYGGQVREIGTGSSTQVLTSASAGDGFTDPATNGNAVSNQTVPGSFTVDFVVFGGETTTSTVTVGANSNSINDSLIPDGFISPLDAEDGFSLVLVNNGDDVFTFESIDLTVIPEPMAATFLGGLMLACVGRRRSA